MTTGKRRLGGWGFEAESMAPSPELLAWLGEHIGPAHPVPGVAAPPPELPTDDLGELPAEARAHCCWNAVLHLEDLLLRRVRLGMWDPETAVALLPALRPVLRRELG